ncbi:hypothetical protein [Paludisphaera mucosa]|uniref:Uncharacterized protein n=1 Tax=Paludisphaera mucosa TaxID=3030827 RepID=A0ABT6FB14_9BACT|nr:hypothetical protein [Paludisphaera mucosa]MDG3004691.1 hypothetical protein [Paludisphaera mucosa]
MSCTTRLLYYRPEAPKRLTPAALAAFAREFAASTVSKPEYGIGFQVGFGKAIDQDDRPTSWDEPGSWVVQEFEYDAEEDEFSDLARMADALDGLPDRPIYRATLLLGNLVRPMYESLWREPSAENETQLGFNYGWSLEAGPIECFDPALGPFPVGWLALNLDGQGDPYPWTYRELIARAEGTPGYAAALDVCRRSWPVDGPRKPGRKVVDQRRLMKDLWPYDDVHRPSDWSWGLQVHC